MPDTVIPFYSLKLGDLVTPKAAIAVNCTACRRQSQLDVVPLLVKRGRLFAVRDLERVLTCAECKNRGFAHVSVRWFHEGR